MSTFLTFAAAETGEGVQLPFPPLAFGALALGVLLLLLLVAWLFRHTAQTMITGEHGHTTHGADTHPRAEAHSSYGPGTQRPTAQERGH